MFLPATDRGQEQMSPLSGRTCLFVSKSGGFAVHLLESPLQDHYEFPPVPPGMRHAVRLLGLSSMIRVYRQTAEGGLPVYEEE